MNDPLPAPSVPTATVSPAVLQSAEVPSNAPRFFAALGNPLRWEMMKMLVKHGPLCASQIAVMLKRDFDGVSKHLRVLRAGGVVQGLPGKDRRQIFFCIPPANQLEVGLLDYGILKLDLRITPQPEPRLQVTA